MSQTSQFSIFYILQARYDEFINRHKSKNSTSELSHLPGFGKRHRYDSDDEEDLGAQAKKEIEIEDELDGKMEDPNKEQREILARAIKEEQLRSVSTCKINDRSNLQIASKHWK